jgi:hypothetical protein
MSQETAAQLFRRKAQAYIDRLDLLEQILKTAQPVEGGYVVSAELIERLRKTTQAA